MTDPMTTPPLDLPAERLATLRDIANAATPGPWESRGYEVETVPEFDLHRFDVMSETVASCDLLKSDATHIAAFDPPTVLQLLDRVEHLGMKRKKYNAAIARAEAAEKKVAAVRELHAKEKHGVQHHCGECLQDDNTGSWEYVEWPCPTITALDGAE